MDIQSVLGLHYQPYNINYKRCGCYCKRVVQLLNAKANTHVVMPLKHIDYDIEIINGLASITLQQKYFNPTDKFLQIEFSFPIDPKSCIYKFVAEFGNKRIEGVVKEKEEAKKQYEKAVKEGKQAVYAEIDPNSKDIMNMEIGNVGPAEEVKISISYLQELNVEQNTFYQFHLPSTISPRYMNNAPGKRFSQNTKNANGQYTWSFKINILTTKKLIYYISSSHNLNLLSQNQNQTQTLLCLPNQQKPNVDLFLLFTVEDFHLPSYVLGRTDVSSTAMLSFIPKFCQLSLDDAMKASMIKKQLQTDMNAAKGQYIFLLDRSGSMGGTRIQKAKQALVLFLQSLPSDTYFNIISFGSTSTFLFNSSQKYSKKNLQNAVTKVKKMSADMGGTQIYNPLKVTFDKKVIQGYPRQIFLLTDGGVSNTEGVINLVQRETKYSRCHSIGIGSGCSQALIKGCAQKGKGKYIFIDDSQNPSEKIIGLLQETLTPVIDNVTLKYDKELVQSIVPNPQSLPYILKNEVVNFYITFKGQIDKKTSFTFGYKDSLNKTPFQTHIQVDPESHNMPFVDKMSHSKVIKNLQNAARQNKPIQQLMYYVKITDKKQQAIKQSVKHQILSEYTAFICVNKELVDGKFEQIKQKGTQKVHVQSIIPQDFMLRGQKLEDIQLSCKSSAAFSSNSYKQMAKKKSSGGFFGNIASSISNGISGMFNSSPPPAMMAPQMNYQKSIPMAPKMAPQMAPQMMKLETTSKRSRASNIQICDSIPMKQSLKMSQKSSKPQISQKKMKKKSQQCQMKQQIMKECQDIQCAFQDQDECEQEMNQIMIQDKSQNQKKQKQINKDTKILQKFKQTKNQSSKKMSSPRQSKAKVAIQDVIKEQSVDGSFISESLFKSLFSSNFDEINKNAQSLGINKQVFITYLVCKWIQKFYPAKQYGLIVKKGYSWIKKTCKLQELSCLDKFLV